MIIAVVGIGLIGGSMALELKKKGEKVFFSLCGLDTFWQVFPLKVNF